MINKNPRTSESIRHVELNDIQTAHLYACYDRERKELEYFVEVLIDGGFMVCEFETFKTEEEAVDAFLAFEKDHLDAEAFALAQQLLTKKST